MNKKINESLLIFEKLDKIDIDTIIELEKEQNITILTKNNILSDYENLTSNYYIVKYNDVIVGYINFDMLIDNIDINSIVVKKEFQRNHIASYILKNVIKICKNLGIPRILLEVRKTNLPAQNLYTKFGFKKIHTRKNYYKDNLEDAYIFELNIEK